MHSASGRGRTAPLPLERGRIRYAVPPYTAAVAWRSARQPVPRDHRQRDHHRGQHAEVQRIPPERRMDLTGAERGQRDSAEHDEIVGRLHAHPAQVRLMCGGQQGRAANEHEVPTDTQHDQGDHERGHHRRIGDVHRDAQRSDQRAGADDPACTPKRWISRPVKKPEQLEHRDRVRADHVGAGVHAEAALQQYICNGVDAITRFIVP